MAGVAGVRADPVAVGQLGEHDLGAEPERMGGGQDRVERLRVQRHPPQPQIVLARGAPVLDRDREIRLSVEHHRQALVALGVPYAYPDVGLRSGEQLDGRGQHFRDARGEGGDRDLARRPARVRRELRLGALQLGEDGVRVGEQDLPGGGQPHAPAAASQQRVPGLVLQRGELLGDGRGREIERGGRGGHRTVVRHGPQDAQPPGVDHPAHFARSARNSTPTGTGRPTCTGAQPSRFIASRASTNAATARSTSAVECAADSCTLIRARPMGTTGYEKPIT